MKSTLNLHGSPQPGQDDPVVEEYTHLVQDHDTRWYSYVEATTRGTRFRLCDRDECLRLVWEGGYAKEVAERFKIGWWWGLMTAPTKRETISQAAIAPQDKGNR